MCVCNAEKESMKHLCTSIHAQYLYAMHETTNQMQGVLFHQKQIKFLQITFATTQQSKCLESNGIENDAKCEKDVYDATQIVHL